jgi:hypothetical protein
MKRVLLVALDSVGIDPHGHNHPDSVYHQSRFLFPAGQQGEVLSLGNAPVPGALVETDVVGGNERGAIECAITYTSIFSGQSAVDQHGLMQGLGLKENALKEMVARDNLFVRFANPCLVNALFPVHLSFLGSSFVQDFLPSYDRQSIEAVLLLDGQPVRLKGKEKHGFAELFTLGEINQNIFVHAARLAGMTLSTWADVRAGQALTGTMTNELESRFNWEAVAERPLPRYTTEEAAEIVVHLARTHDFTFYKYQLADLISHTGRVELAREVFAVIENLVQAVLERIDPTETIVLLTSDHGHLEQVAYTRGHPRSRVPTWYFGPNATEQAARLRRPEALFHLIAEFGNQPVA